MVHNRNLYDADKYDVKYANEAAEAAELRADLPGPGDPAETVYVLMQEYDLGTEHLCSSCSYNMSTHRAYGFYDSGTTVCEACGPEYEQ